MMEIEYELDKDAPFCFVTFQRCRNYRRSHQPPLLCLHLKQPANFQGVGHGGVSVLVQGISMAAAWTVQRGDGYAWGTCSLASRPGCHRRALALRASHVLRAEASVTLTISCSNAAFLLLLSEECDLAAVE